MLRAQLVPVFVDVTPDTFQIDVDAIEEMIGPAPGQSSRPISSATLPTGTAFARSPTVTASG